MKFILVALLVGACLTISWPTAEKTHVGGPYIISEGKTFDGLKIAKGWHKYGRRRLNHDDCNKVKGKSDASFILKKGATLKNVIIYGHVYCEGEGCTLENVYWEDVCDNALTFENGNSTGSKYYVKGGGARNVKNKIIENNSAGTVYISNFYCENSGKLYGACGNCKSGYQGKRNVVMDNVALKNVSIAAELNSNFGDTVTLNNVKVGGGHVCRAFKGRNDGKEPTALGYKCDTKGIIKLCVCK